MDRRGFFASATGAIAAFQSDSVARAQSASQSVATRPADTVARDEDFLAEYSPRVHRRSQHG